MSKISYSLENSRNRTSPELEILLRGFSLLQTTDFKGSVGFTAESVDSTRQDRVVPRVEAEGVGAGVVDDQDVTGFDLAQSNIFGQKITLQSMSPIFMSKVQKSYIVLQINKHVLPNKTV